MLQFKKKLQSRMHLSEISVDGEWLEAVDFLLFLDRERNESISCLFFRFSLVEMMRCSWF